MEQHPVLVTGAAGFIGFSLARRLLEGGRAVVGIDSVNNYYDPALKEARLAVLRQFRNFSFHKLDLADRQAVEAVFRDGIFGPVVHLAAQAGVRYSLQNPYAYLDANLSGFLNVLEGCRRRNTGHLVFASSSSVYGSNTHLPFSVHDNVDHPISLYAATKKANELMAHAYAHLFGLPVTGLRRQRDTYVVLLRIGFVRPAFCNAAGGLLPRLFTLIAIHPGKPGQNATVYFLLHYPLRKVYTRRTLLLGGILVRWSSDFPLTPFTSVSDCATPPGVLLSSQILYCEVSCTGRTSDCQRELPVNAFVGKFIGFAVFRPFHVDDVERERRRAKHHLDLFKKRLQTFVADFVLALELADHEFAVRINRQGLTAELSGFLEAGD